MSLHAVRDSDPTPPRPLDITFEGETVHAVRARLTSTSIELGDDVHRLDDTARLVVTGRVTRIDHVVDDRTGNLLRVETFKIVDALEVPWDTVSHLVDDEDHT